MATGAVTLPEGFVLDGQSGVPTGLPDGFVLDQPHGSGPVANMAAGPNESLAGTLGLPARIVNAIGEPGAIAGSYVGRLLRELTGKPPMTDQPPEGMGRLSGTPNDVKSLMGVIGADPRDVQAVTPSEKFARGLGRGATDAATVFLPSKYISLLAPEGSMTKAIADTMAAQPVTQAVSTGVGEGTSDATGNPMLGLAASLLTAGGMGAGKAALDNFADRRAMIASAPTTDALRSEATQAYKAAEDSGLVVTGDSFGNAVKGIEDAAVKAGVDTDIHPKASAVLRRLSAEADTPKTIQDLDILRRVAKSAAGSIEPDERRIGSLIVDKLDDYVGNLKPTDIAAGDATAASDALTTARDAWSQMRKSELIQGIIDKAQSQASGVENGLRIGFRQLYNNKKALRGFSSDEIDAIRQVADGTFTSNTLRRLGKFSFGSGVQSNVLGGAAGATLAHMAAGGAAGPAAFAVPLAGYAAQRGAQASTQRLADYARAVVASGGQGAVQPGPMSSVLVGNQTQGLNASLLAKMLMEQTTVPEVTRQRAR